MTIDDLYLTLLDDYNKQKAELAAARAENERLRGLLERLLKALPHDRRDYSGVGRCAGCGAILWLTGDPSPRDPCKPDCPLSEAIKLIEEMAALDAEKKEGE